MSYRLLTCSMALFLLAPSFHLLKAAEQEPLVYWVGASRVEAQLSLTRLVVSATTNESVARAGAKALSMERRQNEKGQWRAVLRLGELADRQALDKRAEEVSLMAGVSFVRAVVLTSQGVGEVTRRLVLRVQPGQDVAALVNQHQLKVIETIAYSPNTVIAETSVKAGLIAAVEVANALHDHAGVVFATPLIARQWSRRVVTDPLFIDQWHLHNTGQWGGVAGSDINVLGAWNTVLGQGVNIAIVDDGMQTDHPDLSANARTDIDIDINYGDSDPAPASSNENDNHGTFVAGLAGARDNTLGGRGAAPRAGLVSVRLISAATTDADNAQAMNYLVSETVAANQVSVSSNSWGPSDSGDVLELIEPLMLSAFANGVAQGRGGKGVVYVWAGGNGGTADNSNYDNLANSRYVVAVGALQPNGAQASYSESGANLLVCAPGGGGGIGMVSTDRTGISTSGSGLPLGYSSGDYVVPTDPDYSSSVGTSFSTPLVSGTAALILEANPALTWRDVHHLLVRTAVKNDATGAGWITNGAGRSFNHRYGFGRIDASAAVAMATSSWILAPSSATPLSVSSSVSTAIPDNSSVGVDRSMTITAPAGFITERVEWQVNVTHLRRGDLHFQLVSPAGTVSDIPRRSLDGGANFSNWTFSSVAHWGENPAGTWHLKVIDEATGVVGTLAATTMTVHGYVTDAAAPVLSSVSPTVVPTGSADQTITCSGTGFVSGISVVRWNGVALASTVVSATVITAVVPTMNFTTSGTATVTVVNTSFDTQVSSGQTVTIGSPPSISASATVSTNEDTPVAITLTLADSDTALGLLTVSASSANQTLVANGNLVMTGSTSPRTLTVTPVPNATGTVALTVTVSDGVSSASQLITLTITAVNDPPVALGGNFRTSSTTTAFNGSLSAYDPEGSALTFTKLTNPASGTVVVNSNGTFTFTPAVGSSGLVSFTFEVSDGLLTSAAATVFITLMGDANAARPLIVSEPNDEVIAVGDAFTYSVIADTRRYPVAPALTYELVGAPAGMMISASGVITWTSSGADRHLSFGVVVRDPFALSGVDVQTVVVRVAAIGAPN